MSLPDPRLKLLLDLEARHDELLQRLAELEQRVETVLAEWLSGRTIPTKQVDAAGNTPG